MAEVQDGLFDWRSVGGIKTIGGAGATATSYSGGSGGGRIIVRSK